MARQTQTVVTIIDDFDGKPADENLVETIDFTIEGVSYRMDLRPENAAKFRKDLEKWIAAAPRVAARRGRPKGAGGTRPNTGSGRSREELAAARDWLRSQGHEVSDRGRIPNNLLELFDAQHQSNN